MGGKAHLIGIRTHEFIMQRVPSTLNYLSWGLDLGLNWLDVNHPTPNPYHNLELAPFPAPVPGIKLHLGGPNITLAPTCSRIVSYDTLMMRKQRQLDLNTSCPASPPKREIKSKDTLSWICAKTNISNYRILTLTTVTEQNLSWNLRVGQPTSLEQVVGLITVCLMGGDPCISWPWVFPLLFPQHLLHPCQKKGQKENNLATSPPPPLFSSFNFIYIL